MVSKRSRRAGSASVALLALLVLALPTACGGPTKDAANGSGASAASADAAPPSSGPITGTDDAGASPKSDALAAAAGDSGAPTAASTDTPPSSARGDIHTDDADDACSAAAAALEKHARPAIKACYREGKKKDANLIGGVRLAAAVTPAGKLGNVFTSPNGDKKLLPPAVVKCMVDAVKAADPGDISACKGKSLAIPVQFPSQ